MHCGYCLMSTIPEKKGIEIVDKYILASNRYANLLNFLKCVFLAIWGERALF